MRPQMAFARVQTVCIRVTLSQLEQHHSGHFMRREPCTQSGFINCYVTGAMSLPCASFFAALLDGFYAEMRSKRAPATRPDSFDDDIGIHQDDLSMLHGRPAFTSRTERANRTL